MHTLFLSNLGTLKPLGHKDFYPNGGGLMPGCIFDTMSDADMRDFEELIGEFDPTPFAGAFIVELEIS